MSMIRPKLVIPIAIVVLVAALIYPELWSALPIVLVALICPLMMVFMGGHGAHSGHQARASAENLAGGEYTCPMHSDVRSAIPGICPKCGMALVAPNREEQMARLTREFESVRERQAALAREIERLRGQDGSRGANSALAEAEEVARAADTRQEGTS